MKNAVIYIHGKGGSAGEAAHYAPLFPEYDVIGIEYKTFTPWETGKEIAEQIAAIKTKYCHLILIANSIGAYFAMHADICSMIDRAFFISPIVDMEKLIMRMMTWAGVTEAELRNRDTIKTDFGEDLSWVYLCYVRTHPVCWTVPTEILYGEGDTFTDYETLNAFAAAYNAKVTVMENGEHWFHTREQMRFLDCWIKERL